METHFKEAPLNSSRVIVFFEYRDSVMEAYTLLVQSRPTIRPRIFLGQKGGITQRIQINVSLHLIYNGSGLSLISFRLSKPFEKDLAMFYFPHVLVKKDWM